MVAAYSEAKAEGHKTSMLADTERLCDRLDDIRGRLAKITDILHGPEPRNAGSPSPPSPVESMRRNLDTAFSLMEDIFGELSRIEGRL